jgi:hypothetical protein
LFHALAGVVHGLRSAEAEEELADEEAFLLAQFGEK